MNESPILQASNVESLSSHVEERIVGPCRVLMLKTRVEAVVSWRGSFLTYPNVADGDRLVQALAVQLLDKGTRLRGRFVLAEALENRGAQLLFTSESLRVAFQGRALRDDVPEVLQIMAEELRQPLFDDAEFDKAKVQYQAMLQRSLENTATQARAALSRQIYDMAHPNYLSPTQQLVARLDALPLEQVRAYHARHFGARDLLLVFVGDLDPDAIEKAVRDAFGDWPVHEAPLAYATTAEPREPGQYRVLMPGKMNLDVRMGHALPVRRQDNDYLPLYLANYILGGNFSARLMTKVRDEMGLTYGIHARLSGITAAYEGHWVVGVTLSQDKLEKGIEATLDEVRRFVDEGPTANELQDKKTTVTGGFKVGLATTGGLASTLYKHAIQGFDVGYLDRFPLEVDAVTLDQVRDTLHRYFKPETFQTALAGMFPEREDDQR